MISDALIDELKMFCHCFAKTKSNSQKVWDAQLEEE